MKIQKILKAAYKYIFNKNYRFLINSELHFYDKMPDEKFLKKKFKAVMGKGLDLENPITFNEKLQWLKLYDRKPEYTMMADKYEVRKYIANRLGEEYLIPLIGVWDNPDDIDFDKLPDKFVLKCNHNSGLGMCICKDKSKLNIKKVKRKLKKGLKQDYYLTCREWPYKEIKRKIIAEKYMEDSTGELMDYKFMCFNGKVKCIFTCTERFDNDGLKVTFFDTNWRKLNFKRHYPTSEIDISKPENLDEMICFAEMLSKDINFLRVDFYNINGKIYFGELTFFPGSGYEEFTPESVDEELGNLINITV